MSAALKVEASLIQLSLTVFLLSMAVSQLFYGLLSDAWGRRRVILPAIVLYMLGSFFCFIAPDILSLLLGRFLQGFAAGACVVIARAVARDCYEGKALAVVSAYLSIAWAIVPMLAPVAGGYVQEYFEWHTNFLLLLIFAGICLVATFFLLAETKKGGAGKFRIAEMFSTFGVLARSRQYMGYMLVPALFFSQSTAYMTASPLLYQDGLGLSPAQYGHIIMVTAALYLLGNILNRFLLKKFEMEALIKVGLRLALFGAFLIILFSIMGIMNVWVIAVPLFINYGAAGIIFANCVTLALMPFPERAGAASALLGISQILIGCISSALMAFFSEATQMPLAIYVVFCMSFAYISVRFICRSRI